MCLFRSGGATPVSTPAPIQPRQPDLVRESQLPTKKELTDPEDVAGVEYGTSAKKTDARNQSQATGTAALKINVNTGAGADTGGTGGLKL